MELSFLFSITRKCPNTMLGTEKFGSKMDCQNLRSAQIMASWTSSDGSIDTSAARRPGIVTFYIVHSVKINGQFNQHVFAVVWWYKFNEIKNTLVNLSRFGSLMNMNPVDPPCLCLCSELHKDMLPVQ